MECGPKPGHPPASAAIVLTNGADQIVVPVAVAVAATMAQDGDGNLTGSLQFGGDDVAADQADLLIACTALYWTVERLAP